LIDDEIREAERAVDEAANDVDARHRLTRKRLAAGSGIVGWWQGRRPHDSAVRVTLRFESGGMGGHRHPSDTHGWAVALSGLEDAFDFSSVARTATLIDLSNGRWARLQGMRVADALSWKPETTTVDAWGRPRETDKHRGPKPIDMTWNRLTASGLEEPVVGRGLIPLPQGQIAMRWRSQPIYDTEFVKAQDTGRQINLFQNFNCHASPDGGVKYMGLDTNVFGNGGCLPRGHEFEGTGISVALFDVQRRPFDVATTRAIANSCSVRFSFSSSMFAEWHGADVIVEGAPEAEGESEFVIAHAPPPVFPFAWPLRLMESECFRVDMLFPHGLRDAPSFYVRVTLAGFMGRPVAA